MSHASSEALSPLDPIYLVAAVPLALLTLGSSYYDGAGVYLAYLALTVLCVVQYLRPTRVGWIVATGVYAVATGAFACGVAHDLVSLAAGQRPNIFVDADDSIFFGALMAGTVAITWRLVKAPRRVTSEEV